MDCLIWGYTDLSNWDQIDKTPASLSLLGRWILKEVLKSRNLSTEITFHPHYQFPQVHNLFCSIAHTEWAAVAAVSPYPVGIDIELKNRSVEKVISRVALDSERIQLRKSNQEIQQEIKEPELLLWTGKEAVSKAFGLGIQIGLQNIKIDFDSKIKVLCNSKLPTPHILSSPQLQFRVHKDYLISICSEEQAFLKPPQLLERHCPDFL
jgi:phosphopantetheinyl transferase